MPVSTAMGTITVAPAEALHIAAAKSLPTLVSAATVTIGARTHLMASASAEVAATYVMASTATACAATAATTSVASRVGRIKHTRCHEQGRRGHAQSKHLPSHEASPLAHVLSRADDLGR
jgi:hypothetical protein